MMKWISATILLTIGALYLWDFPRFDVGILEDDAMYITSAQGLSSGSYRDWTQPGAPLETQFFPGYPVFLKLASAVTKLPWTSWAYFSFALAWVSFALAFYLYHRWLPGAWAVVAGTLLAFAPYLALAHHRLLAEWLFLLLNLIVFLLIDRWSKDTASFKWIILIGGLLAAVTLTRPEGILLTAAFSVCLLRRRQSCLSLLAIVLPSLIAVGWWMARNYLEQGTISTYTQIWHTPSIFHAMRTLLLLGGSAIQTHLSYAPQWISAFLASALVIRGMFVGGKLQERSIAAETALYFVSAYLVLRIVWPVTDFRFFIPILPWTIGFMVIGMASIVRGGITRVVIPAIVLIGGMSGFVSAIRTQPAERDRIPHGIFQRIHALPADALIVTNKKALLFLYTGRQGRGDVEAAHVDEFAYRMTRGGATHFWIQPQRLSDPAVLQRWIRANRWMKDWPAAFAVEWTHPAEGTLYKRRLPDAYADAYERYVAGKLDEALKRYPDFPAALNDQAALRIAEGKLAAAEQLLTRALTLRPHYALAMVNLSRIARQRGKKADADHLLKQAQHIAARDGDRSVLQLIPQETAH